MAGSLRAAPTRSDSRAGATVVAALVSAILCTFLLVAEASAATVSEDGGPSLSVTRVDATGERTSISLAGVDYTVGASQVSIVEGGVAVDDIAVMTAVELNVPTEIMYVLDVDNRSMVGAALAEVTTAIADTSAKLPADVKVGIITAGEQAETQSRLTANRTKIRAELQAVAVEEGAAILDGIRLAADSFSGAPDVIRSVVVISTGADTTSQGELLAAESSMIQAGAQLVWVGVGETVANLDRLVDRTAGLKLNPAGSDELSSMMSTAVAAASNRLVVSYPGTTAAGERARVELAVADQTVAFSYAAGLNTTNTLQLAAVAEQMVTEPGFLGSSTTLYVSVFLAFVAIALAVWALGSIVLGGQSSLDNLLARYSNRDETLEDDELQDLLVQTALVRRAVDITENLAARRGFLVRVEELLERASLPVGAGEGMFFLASLSVVMFGTVAVVTGSFFLALVAALVSGIGGYAIVLGIAKRRRSQFEAQLPDALQLLAGTLRAGYSLNQGLAAVSDEISDPMGQELRRAITETQLGRELEDSLAGIAERLDSPDFAWAVMAIGIQREVGGNLSELLMTVAETMVQRDRLTREVSALTAEGRVSAGILSMMPPGLGFVMWVMNPGYISILFSETIGLILVGLAIFSGLAGLIWMKKVITIDV